MEPMTPRQRVLTAIGHRQPDRVALDYWGRPDFTEHFMEYLQVGSVEEMYQKLGVDLRPVRLGQIHKEFEKRTNGILDGRSGCSGSRFIFYQDGSFEDAWGVVRRLGPNGLYDEWISGPFVNNTDLDRHDWPKMDVFSTVEALKEQARPYGDEYFLFGRTISSPFTEAWMMRGMENFLCDMSQDAGFAQALLERVTAYVKEECLLLVRAGVDAVGIFGDVAMQDRMLVVPQRWRELEKPILAELVECFRAENPELLMFFHSDGDITEVLEDLIEIGFDIIDPIQPECMDPARVKREYGDRMTLHGSISAQQTLPHGTPEDVRKEVRERIRTCNRDGGLILGPATMIQNDVPFKNVVALYAAAREFDG